MIPTELVDMILEHLEPESAIAFALTCRALFVKHFSQSAAAQLSRPARATPFVKPSPQSAAARATLLQWLEQDIPRRYFCHGCACLHRWRVTLRYGGYKFYHGPCWWTRGTFNPVMSDSVSSFRPDLTYSWARLVTNRHRYGALHGPPLRDIEAAKHKHDAYYGVNTTHFWRVKLIGNDLYVYGTLVFRSDGKKGNPQSLRVCISNFANSLVCPHFGVPDIPELCRDEEYRNIRSCRVCFTDYQVRMNLGDSPRQTTRKSRQRKPAEGGDWFVEVARWHSLGECRSPYDPQWFNLVSMPYKVSVRRENICGAGTVHRAWMEEDLGSTPVMGAVFRNYHEVI